MQMMRILGHGAGDGDKHKAAKPGGGSLQSKAFSLDLSTVNEGWRYYTQFCCRRLIVAFMIIVLMFVPGACGESVSIGCGSSVAVSGDSSAEGTLASDGSVTQSSVSSVGVIDDLNIDPWIKNTKGDYAEIGVTGTNIAGFTYSDNYYPIKNSVGVSDAVWAQQWMGASSADSLHAYARASNSAGDSAGADLDLKYGSLDGYYNAAYSGAAPWLGMDRVASVQQTLDSAYGNEILATTWAVDPVGDAAGALTDVKRGFLYGYSVLANSAQYSNGLKAAGVSVDSMRASAPSGSILQVMNTYDNKGEDSWVDASIYNGDLVSNSLAYSITQWGQSTSSQNVMASKGSQVEIGSGGFTTALGYENKAYWNSNTNSGEIYLVPVVGGAGVFAAKKNEFKNAVVTTTATQNDISISTSGFGSKTALVLDPRRWEFQDSDQNRMAQYISGIDIYGPMTNSLTNAGYAVTYYSDAAVSNDKVKQMDDYWISVLDTHANPYIIELSKSSDGKTYDTMLASELKSAYTNSNGMAIISGCNSFSETGLGTWADAVSKASVSEGWISTIGIDFSRKFLNSYLEYMSQGYTASQANNLAKATDNYDGQTKQFSLRGNTDFKL